MIRERVRNIPGARITVEEEQGGPPTGAPISIEISGDDFRVLGGFAKKIRRIAEQVPFAEDVRDDYAEGIPSVLVRIDRQKAALFGLSANNIGFALKTAYNGLDISGFREGDEDYDITVRLAEDDRMVTDVLHKLMIPVPSGQLVPLTTLVSIEYSGNIGDIVRIDHERVVTVRASVDETKVQGAVARGQAEELLREFPLPRGIASSSRARSRSRRNPRSFFPKPF